MALGTTLNESEKEIVSTAMAHRYSMDYAGAINLLEPLAREPSARDAGANSVIFGILGILYLDNGEPTKAAAACLRAVQLAPQTSSSYVFLGRAYELLGKFVDAEKSLEEAQNRAPERRDLVLRRAVLKLKAHDAARTSELLDESAKGDNGASHEVVQAMLAIAEGDLTHAVQLFRNAAERLNLEAFALISNPLTEWIRSLCVHAIDTVKRAGACFSPRNPR
jgi:Flp pilus assembly protein TadD